MGRLELKKGFASLIDAAGILAQESVDFQLDLIGDGPMRSELESAISIRGLSDRVRLLGRQPHERVLQAMAAAHVLAMPCVIAPNGDRDGIPNVVLEAMAMSMAVAEWHLSFNAAKAKTPEPQP